MPGRLPQGAGCSASEQCGTAHCQFGLDPVTGFYADCGTCTPAPAVGESCNRGNYCGRGLVCGDGFGSGDRCSRVIEEGAACEDGGQTICAGYLACVDGHCARPRAAGENCAADSVCQPDFVCRAGRCDVRLPAGAACDPMDSQCDYDLFCSDGGVCTPPRDLGETCFWQYECASGSCSGEGTPGSCQPADTVYVAVGEGCSVDPSRPDADGILRLCDELGAGQYCDRASGSCAWSKLAGAACAGDDNECAYPWTCLAGKCAAAPALMCPAR
jgi:hypothetical protein